MNFRRLLLSLTLIFCFASLSNAQMINGSDTLYGNEWINYSQSYYKIKVAEDGMYRLSYNDLNNAGVLNGATIPQGQNFQLIRNGESIPLFVSETGNLTSTDFITFLGKKNRGEIDKYLYDDPAYQVNPRYSLFTDTAIYYLTWDVNLINTDLITEIPNDLTNLPAPLVYCWFEKELEWHESLNKGIERGGSGHVSAKFDDTEGYTKSNFVTNQSVNISMANRYLNNALSASFEVQVMTEEGNHENLIQVNNTTYSNDTFSNWAVKNYQFSVPMIGINNNPPVRIKGNGGTTDKYSFAYIKVRYPRTLNFQSVDWVTFEIDSSWNKSYIEIGNFNYGINPPILYDLTNNVRINTQIINNKVAIALSPSTSGRKLLLVADNAFKSATIEPVTFTSFNTTQGGDYIMLTHSKLFDDGSGFNHIQDYANYRSSTLGGSYTPIIVDIDQVYEQFGYGIDRHEQSIRNFVQWAVKHWNSEYLFIIGKGVYYAKYRNGSPTFEEYELVPSFGYPTSDNLLAAKANTDKPVLAVGRVAAYTPDMVRIYLDKIKETEAAYQTAPQTINDKAWQKNFLHLGGGDENIQDFIKNRLVDMEDSIKQSQLGANVLGYYKNSTNVIQSANSDDVTARINEGLAWITFFGHSAPNTLDFDIGDPNQYDNQGKYPMIYAMGCNTNRLLESPSTLSETYVFVEDRGAIGFIGSTATTSLSNLNDYGKVLYKKLGDDNYGQTIGKVLKATVEDYSTSGFWGSLVRHNIFLHGDPAIKIYPQEGVDYIVNTEKTKIEPNFVNIQQDSFLLKLVINNIGRTIDDSLAILIEQEYPNGNRVELKKVKILSPNFEESYAFWLPLEDKGVVGNNKLHITLDVDNEIAEAPSAAETNNLAVIPFSIISNNATPIYPAEFGIANKSSFALKASTANILSENINYFIEIDTIITFDSPMKLGTQKESSGGLITWDSNITYQDSTVYYWRISMDSSLTNGNGFDWKYSSFIYIPESFSGWNQSHFYQKTEGEYMNIRKDSSTYQQVYGERSKELKIVNGNFPTINFTEASLFLDGFKEFVFWPCNTTSNTQVALVAIIDKDALTLNINESNNMGAAPNCWDVDLDWFIFNLNTTAEREKLIDTLQNVSSDNYVAMFFTQTTNQTMNANQWAADSLTLGTNIFQVLEGQGANVVRDLEVNESPYVLIYKKDNPSWSGFREAKAVNNADILQISTLIEGKQTEGSITSEPIGPAVGWGDIKWRVNNYNALEDTISLDVIGINVNGQDTLLSEGLTFFDLSLDFVNPNIYPYIKLRYNTKDATSLTPAQLDYWRVFYQPLPETALNPDAHLVFHSDTIQQGDEFRFEIGVENITSTAMDSLLVKYVLTNAANQVTETYIRNSPLQADSTIKAEFSIDTRNLSGNHLISIEVNPEDDQRELYHFNNLGIANFYVESDNTAPTLDVTFDGVHIMSGDIISPKPNILISLNDENEFVALDDTATFELYVRYPAGSLRRFYVDNQTVLFRPADGNNLDTENKAEIEFSPEFLEDGTYQLQVRAKDATNNQSGANQYKIDFEVINKAMISNVLNYPNPFTTSTQFVFTLTGSEIPEAMNISIMTVSGKLVKTITKEELGDIRIGLNRTEYTWDGTDDFGNRLANGVYLYRVNLKSATEETYENFNNGTNDYFKNGFGKMVILR